MDIRKLADNSIKMFLEYRDRHGKTEEEARTCAIAEMWEGENADVPGITPNAKEDLQADTQQLKAEMSEYYEGKYGPKYNKQYPAVTTDHIIAAGFYIEFCDGVDMVKCPCGIIHGTFDDVTWGHGASGMLFIKGKPMDIPSKQRMSEIKHARKILMEADLQNTTAQGMPAKDQF